MVPSTCSDKELRHIRNSLPDSVVVQRVDERLTALGNCVSTNDHVALVHTDIDKVWHACDFVAKCVYYMSAVWAQVTCDCRKPKKFFPTFSESRFLDRQSPATHLLVPTVASPTKVAWFTHELALRIKKNSLLFCRCVIRLVLNPICLHPQEFPYLLLFRPYVVQNQRSCLP